MPNGDHQYPDKYAGLITDMGFILGILFVMFCEQLPLKIRKAGVDVSDIPLLVYAIPLLIYIVIYTSLELFVRWLIWKEKKYSISCNAESQQLYKFVSIIKDVAIWRDFFLYFSVGEAIALFFVWIF